MTDEDSNDRPQDIRAGFYLLSKLEGGLLIDLVTAHVSSWTVRGADGEVIPCTESNRARFFSNHVDSINAIAPFCTFVSEEDRGKESSGGSDSSEPTPKSPAADTSQETDTETSSSEQTDSDATT